MRRIRRCNGRCHNAKGKRCACWCSGMFHGKDGADNRAALAALDETGQRKLLEGYGFMKGKTAFIHQCEMQLVKE